MADKARRYTDRQLAQMEKHITEIYAQATDEITAKWEKYMANAEKRVSGLQKEYDEAVKRGDKDEIEKAKARLDKAKYNETLANARYKEMVDQTTTQMAMANQMAVAYMNGQMPNIYVANYNQLGSDANAMGVSYTLLDENTLSRAIKGEIPRKTINVPKDKRWNEKYINSQVTQGIIQGESMDKIAKRIFPEIMDKSDFSNLTEEEKNKLIQRNKNSSIRAARTMVTGVENLGRLDGMKQLESEGIIQKKVWMATPDDRTRESHIDIDGEEQDLNEYFSNGCMFPGDGDGPHEEVWNCRCSMRTHIVGIRRKDGTIKQVDYGMQGSAHEDAIEEEKERRASSKTEKPKSGKKSQSAENTLKQAYEKHREINGLKSVSVEDLPTGFISAELNKVSDTTIQSINETLAQLTAEYDTPLMRVRTLDAEEYFAHQNTFAFVRHDYETDTAELIINQAKMGDYDTMVSRLAELRDAKYMVGINDDELGRYVTTHEFAHTLFDTKTPLNDKRNWVGADYEKTRNARKEVEEVYSRYLKDVEKIDTERKKYEMDYIMGNESAGEKARELSRQLDDTRISRYSMTDTDEFMAECFTYKHLGLSGNEYADEVNSIIDKYYRM